MCRSSSRGVGEIVVTSYEAEMLSTETERLNDEYYGLLKSGRKKTVLPVSQDKTTFSWLKLYTPKEVPLPCF